MTATRWRCIGRLVQRTTVTTNLLSESRRTRNSYSFCMNARALVPTGMLVFGFSLFRKKTKEQEELEQLKNVMRRADWMYERYMIDMLYEFLLEEVKQSRHPEILWRLARVAFEKGKCCRQRDGRIQLFAEAMAYINEAVRVNGDISAVHKWYAILLDAESKGKSTEKRLESASIVRQHLEKALELDANDPTSWYILGVWFFTFADLPWYRRRLALLMKYKLPEATYKMALDCFLTAERISTNFYSQNLLMIGKTYINLQQYDLAKAYLTKILQYVVITTDDQDAHDEAVELLKNKHVAEAKDIPVPQ